MLPIQHLTETVDRLIDARHTIQKRRDYLSSLPFGVVDANEEDYLKFEVQSLNDAISALEHLIDTYGENRVFSTQSG